MCRPEDAYAGVKKVALVQHAINPHLLLGTANADEAKTGTVEKNFEVLTREMASSYAVVPLVQMVAHPAYAAVGGKPRWDGFYSAKGLQFFSADEDTLRGAIIPADTAKKLCEGLSVDAVAVASDGLANHLTEAQLLDGLEQPDLIALVDGVRLPTSTLRDDVSLLVARRQ